MGGQLARKLNWSRLFALSLAFMECSLELGYKRSVDVWKQISSPLFITGGNTHIDLG